MALRRGLVGVCARLGEAAAAQSSLFCTAEAPTVAVRAWQERVEHATSTCVLFLTVHTPVSHQAPTLRAVAATWNVSWKGFSSCSARQQQAGGGDGDQSAEAKAAEATSTAAEQQQPEGGQQQEQPEKELTMEECLQAFNALQEELEAEKKKVHRRLLLSTPPSTTRLPAALDVAAALSNSMQQLACMLRNRRAAQGRACPPRCRAARHAPAALATSTQLLICPLQLIRHLLIALMSRMSFMQTEEMKDRVLRTMGAPSSLC